MNARSPLRFGPLMWLVCAAGGRATAIDSQGGVWQRRILGVVGLQRGTDLKGNGESYFFAKYEWISENHCDIITPPARGIMGNSGPEGVLALPSSGRIRFPFEFELMNFWLLSFMGRSSKFQVQVLTTRKPDILAV